MDQLTFQIITISVLLILVLLIMLLIIRSYKKQKLKEKINELEFQKNQIDGSSISPELNKIETFLKNEKLETMYTDWCKRLEQLKKTELPKLTDMIIEADYSLSKVDHKSSVHKLAKLELEVYKTQTYSDVLLAEIMEITNSEEKNRAIIIKLKEKYRELYRKFDAEKGEYEEVSGYVKTQFENISARFDQFEDLMEKNEYTEVTKVVKALEEMLKHIEVVVEETPMIVVTANHVLDKKINEVQSIYDQMKKDGYPLDYLNIDYNIQEARKKINDSKERLKVLNLEDSLFELNILVEYFDSLFNDFEREKRDREIYEKNQQQFVQDLEKLNTLMVEIFQQINELKKAYDLSSTDVNTLNDKRQELTKLNEDYKILIDHTKNNTFAYSKLITEINGLTKRLKTIENEIQTTLKSIGNMKEDELRARQQLDEIKTILKDAKLKIRDYNLPIIPKTYYVEAKEADAAIKEVLKELGKMPITIEVLNTRVDTARDLALKLFTNNKDIIKTAMFAEMALVYGNRYRPIEQDLEKHLAYAELLFYRGEYQKSLETTVNALNRIDGRIYDKLVKLYEAKCENFS